MGIMRRDEVGEDLVSLAFDFLYFFARFEYALKANGYLKKTEPGQPAEAGWRQFRERWEGDYKSSEAAVALIAANPKKQIIGDDGMLAFRAVGFPASTCELGQVIGYCQTVRNNLFHGGKSSTDGFDSPERTKCCFPSFSSCSRNWPALSILVLTIPATTKTLIDEE
uniref:Rcorf110 n=2 Tax=Rhizobium rhizogenes TaxID=359 RepID=A8W0F8_RHIRH|nr:rcorf110 [Rhizobium rhizogenes]